MHENLVIDILKEHGITYIASVPCDKAKDLCFLLPGHFDAGMSGRIKVSAR